LAFGLFRPALVPVPVVPEFPGFEVVAPELEPPLFPPVALLPLAPPLPPPPAPPPPPPPPPWASAAVPTNSGGYNCERKELSAGHSGLQFGDGVP
jgi:hypothetical protein